MIKRILFLFLFSLPVVLAAQTKTVTGKVKSAEDATGIPGASVLVQGTSKGVATDAGGSFSLELQPNEDALVISSIGYKTQTIQVGHRSFIEVVLESDAVSLEEVVVIGYGTVRKSDLTGSVSSVRGKELTTVPAINPMQSLQGKIPGVQVASSSGAPGAGTY